MVMSVASATFVNWEHTTAYAPVPSWSSSSSSMISPRSSSQFPQQLQRARIGSEGISFRLRSRSPRPLLVRAKKQTFSSLDDLLKNSDTPVLVDFYATWCGPCQLMVPVLNEVSAHLKDKIRVVKIDTEKYPAIANKYRIEALPTFIIFKDEEPHDRFEGALTANQLIQRIESSLKVKQ